MSLYLTNNQELKAENPALLVTVDCGMSAFEEVEYAKSKGFEVLIVDHHTKPETIPDCFVFGLIGLAPPG